MSDTLVSLQRKISSAQDLHSVVRTMKAMAAASIGQYEKSVTALDDYYQTLQRGLLACFLNQDKAQTSTSYYQQQSQQQLQPSTSLHNSGAIVAVVFGSDQGLVGQFNEALSEYVTAELAKYSGEKIVWTVGERIQLDLAQNKLSIGQHFALPNAIAAVTLLVGEILLALETGYEKGDIREVYLFHNQPQSGALYNPHYLRLLPLDKDWRAQFSGLSWPSKNLPEVIDSREETLLGFMHEYLFISLFRACAESLASESASRLMAMQRAEKNINELLDNLKRDFHQLRQNSIDEELFDLVSGFDALNTQ
jgi:F-type H+-transporting ATPase subunit gamma